MVPHPELVALISERVHSPKSLCSVLLMLEDEGVKTLLEVHGCKPIPV